MMLRKALDLAILLILLSMLTVLSIGIVSAEDDPGERWALIICGSEGGSFSNNAQYMYHVLSEHYDFDGICYLDVYIDRPGVDAFSTKINVRHAIHTTLASWSDENDLVFIYFTSHGGGYNAINNLLEGYPESVPPDSLEVGGDEGNEVSENALGLDVNGDGDKNDWVSVDECMQVEDGWYWDDELAADLNNVHGRIVFVRQGCLEGNQSCFGGGLIDDLSAPNRIIMSSSNETWYSYGDLDDDGYSEWSEAFIDALHGERTYYNGATNEIVHTGINVDADSDDNGYVSLWEAWEYAWNHDDARWVIGHFTDEYGVVDETPWFDDDGDGLPTFIYGSDHLDDDWQGVLAKKTFLDCYTLSISSSCGGTIDPAYGIHTYDYGEVVTVTASADSGYGFAYWILDAEYVYGSSINVIMDSDHTLKAYFRSIGWGNPGPPPQKRCLLPK